MRRSLLMGLLALTPAYGQVFSIGAPQPSLVLGDKMTLTPLLRDPAGVLIPATDWVWESLNPDILSVDSSGLVKGVKLGTGSVKLTAPREAGTLFGQLQIQIQPNKITLVPAAQTINVGDSLQYSATAYDFNNQPIGNVAFTWDITASDGRPNLVPWNVTIDGNGKFSGGSAGLYTIRALINYFPVQQGLPSHFEAEASINVIVPPAFQQNRLVTSDPVPTKRLLPAPGVFVGSEAGSMAFTASADGYSTAMISLEAGKTQAVITTGQPSPSPGGDIAGYESVAMNSLGDMLIAIQAGDSANGALLARPAGGAKGAQFVLLDNANGADSMGNTLLNLTFLDLTPYCLNDNGTAVIKALYYPPNDNVARDGLFLLRNALSPQITPLLLWSAEQSVPSVSATGTPARIQFIFDNTEHVQGWASLKGLGIDNQENVYFMAQSSTGRGLFMITAGGTPQKVVAVGDTFASSKVKDIQDLTVIGSGDVAVRVDTQDGNPHMSVFRQGKLFNQLVVPGNPNPRILAVSAAGILFEGSSAMGKPEALYRWDYKTVTDVLDLSANVAYISTAAMNSKGTVTAVVRSQTNDFLIVQPGGTTVFASGAASNQTAAVDLKALVRGSRTALPSVAMSNPGSLFDLDGSGNAVPRVVLGQTLGSLIFGGADNFAEDAAGNQYFVSANTLFRSSGSTITSVLAASTKASDGAILTPRLAMAGNSNSGAVVDCTTNLSTGERRLYRIQNNTLTLVTKTQASFDGRTIADWNEAAIDDNGNVAVIYVMSDGSQELVVWNGPTAQIISNTRNGSLAGENIARFDRIRGAGGVFYGRFALTADFTHAAVARFTSTGGLETLVKSGDGLPDGTTLGDLRLVDGNRNGQTVFTSTVVGTGTQMLGFRGSDGKLKIVAANNNALQTGDYLVRFSDTNIRDDGTVYFLAFDVNDRALVFGAAPGNPTGPIVNPGGVVSSADYSGDTLTPGMWFTVYGQNLGQAATWNGDPNTFSLGGASVSVCGIKATLAYNSGPVPVGGSNLWQINALMPDAAGQQTSCPIAVTVNGQAAGSVTVNINQGLLELFTFAGASSGVLPVISHLDYSVVGAVADGLQPAKPGELLLAWGTGNCSSPVPTATVNGLNATVLFSGRVTSGLCQINFTVPAGVTGNVPIKFSTSPHTYTLAAQ